MSTPLRDLLNDLLLDPSTRAAFEVDPARFLADHGWESLDGADVHAALGALVHEVPIERAAVIAPLVADGTTDEPSSAGAISGLEAAAAAFDAELGNGSGPDDPAASFDEPAAERVRDLVDDDPAVGIDAGPSDGGAEPDADMGGSPAIGTANEDGPAEHEVGPTDPEDSEARFGEPAAGSSLAADDEADSAPDSTSEEPWGNQPDGPAEPPVDVDGESWVGFVEDDHGLPPYDPSEEAVGLGEPDEPDDGFPY